MTNLAQKLKKVKKPSEVHQTDVYSETHQLSRMRANYEKAREELTVQPYSQRMKPLDNFLYGFRSVYHFISVILGLLTCVLISLVFVGVDVESNQRFPVWLLILMALLVGALLAGVLVAVELAKITFAKNIFKTKAKRGKIGNFSIMGLTFLVFVSIALSGIGGTLLSYKMGDKSQQLGQTLKAGEKKIAGQYDQRLAQLNQVIAGLENLSVDKKARRWGLTKEEQANLETSRAEKMQLMAAKDKALGKLATQHDDKLKANQTYTSTTMYVALGLITFLELITIYAYFFHYHYLARTENEGVQFNILPNSGQVLEKPKVIPPNNEQIPEKPKVTLVEAMIENLTKRVDEALMVNQTKSVPAQDWGKAIEQKIANLSDKLQDNLSSSTDAVMATNTSTHNEISLRPTSMKMQQESDKKSEDDKADVMKRLKNKFKSSPLSNMGIQLKDHIEDPEDAIDIIVSLEEMTYVVKEIINHHKLSGSMVETSVKQMAEQAGVDTELMLIARDSFDSVFSVPINTY